MRKYPLREGDLIGIRKGFWEGDDAFEECGVSRTSTAIVKRLPGDGITHLVWLDPLVNDTIEDWNEEWEGWRIMRRAKQNA